MINQKFAIAAVRDVVLLRFTANGDPNIASTKASPPRSARLLEISLARPLIPDVTTTECKTATLYMASSVREMRKPGQERDDHAAQWMGDWT
jgi:hypothetical protein